ncbi:chromosome partitioning protein [Pseudobutyrivibrio sp. 49]|nr:AAA family ATPase [Pseudobutyrivibrio sp. 49]SDI55988.1 chromosome partitioning protein [Pseudobutyrivibrio sp. 49]
MSVVLIGNRRGGVGKTTIVINMATKLLEKGYRVLLDRGDCCVYKR